PGQSKGSHTLAARHLEKPVGAAPVGDVPLPAGGADRNAIPPYETPNLKVSKHFILDAPLRTSALRTLGGYGNVFAAESFVDELAAAAGADPVEFGLRHLKDPRTRAVAAVDVGQIVNPDGVVNQIEGGIIQSASWTLKEEIRFDLTRVKTRSWADYPIMRFDEVPEIDVVLLNRPDAAFLGVGEGSQGPAAAAIANAIAHATGRRLRALPFTPERVKLALA